jgi:hypothetical protein
MQTLIILFSLWFYPVFAKVSMVLTKGDQYRRNRIAYISSGISGLVILAICFNISTTSLVVNYLLLSIIYYTISFLLLLAYSSKDKATKIISGIAMFCVFGLGYLVSTIGMLGVMMASGDAEPIRTIKFSDNIIYRQYGSGGATVDVNTITISICKTIIPGLQREIVKKTYTEGYYIKGSPTNDTSPTLYSTDFSVKYNAEKQQVVLLDSVKKEIINLSNTY